MGEAIDYTSQQSDDVEIVVHVDETLGEDRRAELVGALENIDGILAAEFCPLRYHLMLLRYDRDTLSSQEVLA